ncbi:MAG: GNAT family N-acetyltransferase [Ilumatobacteraceae bacterium]
MIVDAALVHRVERTAARLTALEVDALASVAPSAGAHWRTLDSGVAAVMGPGRYVNRAVGAVLGEQSAEALLDELEAVYDAAGLPASLEVCPWARTDVVAELRRRGYSVDWFRNVYAHGLRTLPPRARMDIDEVDDDTVDVWSDILGSQFEPGSVERGNSDEFCTAVHRVPGTQNLIATIDGRAIGTGSLTPVGTVAWLGGASTLPEARGRGAQHALLVDRLHRARRMGCTLAAVTAVPDGVSARNLLRVGFQLLYTQAVLTRP